MRDKLDKGPEHDPSGILENLNFRFSICNLDHLTFKQEIAEFYHRHFTLADIAFKLNVYQISKGFDDFSSSTDFHNYPTNASSIILPFVSSNSFHCSTRRSL